MVSTEVQSDDTGAKTTQSMGTLETIQFLRFVAAALVLFTHVSFFVHNRVGPGFPIWVDGAQGVALFFVISGFIMTVTTHHSYVRNGASWKFTVSRLIRIVPLYWVVNAAKLLGLIFVPSLIVADPDVKNVILSLLFLPSRNASGQIEAFYGVGWSLNFEMMFYALFAVAIFLRIRPSLMVIPILLVAILFSGVKEESWPAAAFLLNFGLINFIWGILIGEWYVSGRSLSFPVAAGLILVGGVMMFVSLGPLESLLLPRLHFGAIVLGFVSLEKRIGQAIPRSLSFLGDASYSLYLTHPMVGVFAVIVLHRVAGGMPYWLLFMLVSAVCITASAVTFVLFERPVTRMLRNRFMPR